MDIPSYLMGRIAGSKNARTVVVDELPETGEPNIIYLVPKQTTGDNDIFDEYIWVENDWELIGSTAIDISGKQDIMQFSIMPTADSTTVGKIIQYTGTTNANYTNGYFYIGINNSGTYGWSNVDVQPAPDMSLYATLDFVKNYDKGVCLVSTSYENNIDFTGTYFTGANYIASAMKNYMNEHLQEAFIVVSPSTTGHIIIPMTKKIPSNLDISASNYYVEIPCFMMSESNMVTRLLKLTYSYDATTRAFTSISIGTSSSSDRTAHFLAKTDMVLEKANTTSYTPTGDYNPATKKYVDDAISSAIGSALGGSY